MNSSRLDLRRSGAAKLVRNTGSITTPVGGSWTTAWQDMHADMSALVRTDGGLLVCETSMRVILSSAPQYQVMFRWLIDGVAPDTTDAHTGLVNYSNDPITGDLKVVVCRAAAVVRPGLHRVSLQGRTDVAATTSSIAASATEPLMATVTVS